MVMVWVERAGGGEVSFKRPAALVLLFFSGAKIQLLHWQRMKGILSPDFLHEDLQETCDGELDPFPPPFFPPEPSLRSFEARSLSLFIHSRC